MRQCAEKKSVGIFTNPLKYGSKDQHNLVNEHFLWFPNGWLLQSGPLFLLKVPV